MWQQGRQYTSQCLGLYDFAWFSASQIFAVRASPGGLTAAGPSV